MLSEADPGHERPRLAELGRLTEVGAAAGRPCSWQPRGRPDTRRGLRGTSRGSSHTAAAGAARCITSSTFGEGDLGRTNEIHSDQLRIIERSVLGGREQSKGLNAFQRGASTVQRRRSVRAFDVWSKDRAAARSRTRAAAATRPRLGPDSPTARARRPPCRRERLSPVRGLPHADADRLPHRSRRPAPGGFDSAHPAMPRGSHTSAPRCRNLLRTRSSRHPQPPAPPASRCRATRPHATRWRDRQPVGGREQHQTARLDGQCGDATPKRRLDPRRGGGRGEIVKPPANVAGGRPRGSSSRARGLPAASAMIRSRTSASSTKGTTESKRAWESRSAIPFKSAISASPTKGAGRSRATTSRSAGRRGADGRRMRSSALWPGPTTAHRRRTDRAEVQLPDRPSVQHRRAPPRAGWGGSPPHNPKILPNASRCGPGSSSIRPNTGPHGCSRLASGSSISDSTPAPRNTRYPDTNSTTWSTNAVLPIPGFTHTDERTTLSALCPTSQSPTSRPPAHDRASLRANP